MADFLPGTLSSISFALIVTCWPSREKIPQHDLFVVLV